MTADFDILGLGCSAVDELLYVDAYPTADSKQPVHRWERHCGGLTATALVAAARLGARCAYAGTLGTDDASQFVLGCLLREGIDINPVRRLDSARPVRAVIVVEEHRQTRTILFDESGAANVDPDWPPDDMIRSAQVLFVDHVGVPRMIRAARIARAARIPVVADLESNADPQSGELLGLVDHLILSRGFAEKITGNSDPAAAARRLWSPARRAVAVTCGSDGCWYMEANQPEKVCHQPAFPVNAIDTTGCGDVFHGAYAAGLVRKLDIGAAVRFAAAAAALKATQRGGQAGIANLAAVEQFLANARL